MSTSKTTHDDAGERAEISSTSSSEYLSPTVPGTSELLRALCVEVVENQRWFPIHGWATSRLHDDPPNFTLPLRAFSKNHTANQQAFAREFAEANPTFFRVLKSSSQNTDDFNAVPQEPLSYVLPSGCEWEGDWYVTTDNPRGCDPAGWRYGASFDVAGAEHRVHFRKTWSQDCVVRRRVWRRYVHLAGPLTSHNQAANDGDLESNGYLQEKQDEMKLAESLKEKRAQQLASGGTWTTEDDLAAEEEIRNFVRTRRGQYSTTNRLSNNPSFANPFEPADSPHRPAPPTVTPQPTSHAMQQQQSSRPPDTTPPTTVTDFRQYEPSETHSVQADDALGPERTISAFLPSTSPVASTEQQPTYPVNVDTQSSDFDAIFAKFVSNPEVTH